MTYVRGHADTLQIQSMCV